MDWKKTVGILLVGAMPTFLVSWLETLWPMGSWQWGVLTIFCAVAGPVLILWDSRIAPKLRLLNIEIKQPKDGDWGWGRTILILVFGPPLFILGMTALTLVWLNLVCFFDQECVSRMAIMITE